MKRWWDWIRDWLAECAEPFVCYTWNDPRGEASDDTPLTENRSDRDESSRSGETSANHGP
jgi:hypothetical protein